MSGVDGKLAVLNTLPREEAAAVLRGICGCGLWVEGMIACRPFESAAVLLEAAEQQLGRLGQEDWLEAFSHHPRIGERDLTVARLGPGAAVAAKEQSGMAGASDTQRAEFARGNRLYEERFGHVFLICATGKSAGEMLAQLRERLGNDRATELQNAAKQQRLISRLRLERWLAS